MRRRRLPAGARVSSFTGLSLRSLRARPLRSILTAAAIVLGVGMVFGVLLLVGTIHSTFDRLYDSVYGGTDVVVSGEQSVGSLPEAAIDRVRAVDGVEAAAGDIGSVFRTVDERGRANREQSAQVYMVGVDYDQPDPTDSTRVAGRDPIAGRGEIELAGDWAEEQGLSVGDGIDLSTPTGTARFRIAGLFEFEGGLDLGGYGSGSMPIADARGLMDKPGIWDEISVIVADGASAEGVRDRLDAAFGRGVEVATPEAKGEQVQDQLAALDIVLYFFSGIALFVGAFLILNSFNMTVLQRMREIGTLRALGATDLRVARGITAEALLLGLVGSVLGLALGAGLAVVLIDAMQSFGMPVSSIEYSSRAVVAALVTGLLATVVGAAWPVLRAARIPPIRALVGGTAARRALGVRRALAGLVLFVPGLVGGGLFWFGTNSTSTLVGIGAIGSTLAMFVGMALLAPYVVLPLVRLMARPLRGLMPAEGRLAADAAQSNPTRTAATAATLLIALSVVVVNSTVAESFVGSIRSELDARFARDLTVQPIGYQEYGPPQAGLSRKLLRQVESLPQVGSVARRRSIFVLELPGGGAEGTVVAYEPGEYNRVDRIDYEGAPEDAILAGLDAGGIVLAKAYAQDRGLEVGDDLRLQGAAGAREAEVVGIADTFEAGGQTVQISLRTMAEIYGVRTDSQLVIAAASPEQREELSAGVEALLAREYPGLEAVSNAEFKQSTTDAINQQFGFFNAIVAIAVLVGVLGIVNTLSMSVLERTREIGVLRALGASRWRVRRTMADESLLISLAGSLAGIAAGLLIGIVWVFGMRQTTFPGIETHLPLILLAVIAVLGVLVGVVAAILPARRAARLDPLEALHYE